MLAALRMPVDGPLFLDDVVVTPVDEVSTDRVFTTADVARGRLLLVDSPLDEDQASRNSEVVVLLFDP